MSHWIKLLQRFKGFLQVCCSPLVGCTPSTHSERKSASLEGVFQWLFGNNTALCANGTSRGQCTRSLYEMLIHLRHYEEERKKYQPEDLVWKKLYHFKCAPDVNRTPRKLIIISQKHRGVYLGQQLDDRDGASVCGLPSVTANAVCVYAACVPCYSKCQLSIGVWSPNTARSLIFCHRSSEVWSVATEKVDIKRCPCSYLASQCTYPTPWLHLPA